MPIAFAREGEELKIVEIYGGGTFSKRVTEMGIYPGALVKILVNQGSGPIIVISKDTKIALGRGMAMKIIGEPFRG